jgi:hypothetical protein
VVYPKIVRNGCCPSSVGALMGDKYFHRQMVVVEGPNSTNWKHKLFARNFTHLMSDIETSELLKERHRDLIYADKR